MKKYHVVGNPKIVDRIDVIEFEVAEGDFKEIIREYQNHTASFHTKEEAQQQIRQMYMYYVRKNLHNAYTEINRTEYTDRTVVQSKYGHNPADLQFVYGPYKTLEEALEGAKRI